MLFADAGSFWLWFFVVGIGLMWMAEKAVKSAVSSPTVQKGGMNLLGKWLKG